MKSPVRYVMLLTLAWLASCDVPNSSISPTPYEKSLVSIANSGDQQHFVGVDAQFSDLARQIPGFAGVYYEGDRLIVTGKTTAALQSQLSAVTDRFSAASVEVRAVRHSFLDLAAVATALEKNGFPEGMTLLDIDEKDNVVRIGYNPDKPNAAKSLAYVMDALGVPEDLYRIEPSAPAVPLATLRDNIRPTVGGTAINDDGCTFWNISGPNYERAFITAAHCTGQIGVNNSTTFYQNQSGPIGVEYFDPPYQYYSMLSNCIREDCRLSDAAIGLYAQDVPATRGLIARPVNKSRTVGSIQYAGHFQVSAKYSVPVVGMTLNKVGQRTGWTYGDVTETCAHVYTASNGPHWILCSTMVNAGAFYGDSGSPVFRQLGSVNVGMYGILWGGAGTPHSTYWDSFWMSPFSGINEEFGGAMWPLLVSTGISGPTEVPPSENGTWTAVPNGDYSPYTYHWYKNGLSVGTGSSYVGQSDTDFTLRVDVVSRFGWFSSAEINVVVVDDCYPEEEC